jgi:predicted DNA-binding protein
MRPEVTTMVKLTLRVSEQLHEKLRWLAYRERKSQHAILLEIVEKALAKVEVPKEGRK